MLGGVAEMLRLELEKPLLDAGGCYMTRSVSYDEVIEPAQAEELAAPLDRMLPGVPGALDVGHPQACEALIQVLRQLKPPWSVESGMLTLSHATRQWCVMSMTTLPMSCAVGSSSAPTGGCPPFVVISALSLYQNTPRIWGKGMLVDGLDAWPARSGTEGDLLYYVFPRANGRATVLTARHRPEGPLFRPGPACDVFGCLRVALHPG